MPQWLRALLRPALTAATGAALALAYFSLAPASWPGSLQGRSDALSQEQFDEAVAQSLQTLPLPSMASRAAALVAPSVVRVRSFGPAETAEAAPGGAGESDRSEAVPSRPERGQTERAEPDRALPGRALTDKGAEPESGLAPGAPPLARAPDALSPDSGQAPAPIRPAPPARAADPAAPAVPGMPSAPVAPPGSPGAAAPRLPSTPSMPSLPSLPSAPADPLQGPERGAPNKDEAPAEVQNGVGTGVVIKDDGLILSNLHVVAGARRITVVFADGSESPATITGARPEHDLAVLKASRVPDDLQPAVLRATGDLSEGDGIVVVGFPFDIGPSVSAGVISGFNREYQSAGGARILSNLIQFDAAANPGNSGGPLATMDGEVIGIVTAILNPNNQRSFVGIGFAVPIENAMSAAGLPPH